MSVTQHRAPRQGLARRGDVADRVRELERMVEELGHVRVEGHGASSWAPTGTPSGMTRDQALRTISEKFRGKSPSFFMISIDPPDCHFVAKP